MAVLMKGFAIKKVLKNGKVTNENGFLGEYDGDIAKIVEMNNGKAKYTELNKRDIEKIISMQGHQESLEERLLANIKSQLPRHHRKYVHHQLHPYHTRKNIVVNIQKNIAAAKILNLVEKPLENIIKKQDEETNYITFIIAFCSGVNK